MNDLKQMLVPAPTPTQILCIRESVSMSQTQAATAVGVTLRTWQNWESGLNVINPACWAVFLLTIGQHPDYNLFANKKPSN